MPNEESFVSAEPAEPAARGQMIHNEEVGNGGQASPSLLAEEDGLLNVEQLLVVSGMLYCDIHLHML